MQRLYLISYEYKEDLKESDYRDMTKSFIEHGSGPSVLAHYERLDGRGGFLVEELPADAEKDFELTVRYARWVKFHIYAITTMADAFPVIQHLYG
ncbi:MAG TPA: DUF3303 family protein [Acidimicrobiales bacterium]|nr:DUF3303 family protein [Acidimicrobiales bacterium]